jgi:drug/metabolite transporter (DMT)-like permease
MIDVLLTALTVSFLFGITPITHKYLFSIHPISKETLITSGAFFYSMCAFVYFFLNRKKVVKDIKTLPYTTLMIMAASAIVCGFFANYLYFKAIQHSSSYIVSALIFSSPMFTFVLAYLFLKEEVNYKSAFGVFLIVLGVIMLATSKAIKDK